MPTETTPTAVPFLSATERAERRWPSYFIPGTEDVRKGCAICIREEVEPLEAELTRYKELVEEARVALEEEHERLESRCNEDDARGRDSYWVRHYRYFQKFLLTQIDKLPKPPHK